MAQDPNPEKERSDQLLQEGVGMELADSQLERPHIREARETDQLQVL